MVVVVWGGMRLKGGGEGGIREGVKRGERRVRGGNRGGRVKEVREWVKRVERGVEYVEKVWGRVRGGGMLREVIEGEKGLKRKWVRRVEEGEKMEMKGVGGMSWGVEEVVGKKGGMMWVRMEIVGSEVKMKERGGIKDVRKCVEKVREEEGGVWGMGERMWGRGRMRGNLGVVRE